MLYETRQNILHVAYLDKERDSSDFKNLIDLADIYEGSIKNRIGFNFPMKIVPPSNLLRKYKADYVIVYKQKDIQTKKHELRHAMFFLDKEYRDSVEKLWNSITDVSKQKILTLLKKMNYPDDQKILLDEFQAYYYTEKQNFFPITFN